MQLAVLMAFVVALTFGTQTPGTTGARWGIPALAGYLLVTAAIGGLRTVLGLRAMAKGLDLPPKLLSKTNLANLAVQAWLVAGLAGLMLAGYGNLVASGLHLESIPLACEAALLAPFVGALLLSWLLDYPLYRAMRRRLAFRQALEGLPARPGWSLREYFSYNLRHHLLFVAVPIGLVVLAIDLLALAGPHLPEPARQIVVMTGTAACSAGVFLCAPLLIVRIWRTARLPPGPLRDELLDLGRRMRLRFRDLLVWHSGGMIANAGVMGLLGPVRYVLLSDALLEHLERRQVKAIFAHEAGHIASHHLFCGAVFVVATATLLGSLADLVISALRLSDWAGEALTLAVLGPVWWLGFGWLSRRFERHSDAIAAWACAPDGPAKDGTITPEGAAIFCQALQRVAQLNGIPIGQWSWRHGSIASRIEHILWLGGTGGSRRNMDRLIRRIKLWLWLGSAAAGIVLAIQLALRG